MHRRAVQFLTIVLFLSGFARQSSVSAVEILDENTGMTEGVLPEPIAFVETGIFDLLVPDKQPSVVYVGPVEWDRSGDLTYVLWIQVVAGVDGHRLDDIHARGAVNLKLKDGSVALSEMDLPRVPASPYRPMTSTGQTAYFGIDVATLKRMAASQQFTLSLRAGDLTMVAFIPTGQTRTAIKQFMLERGIDED